MIVDKENFNLGNIYVSNGLGFKYNYLIEININLEYRFIPIKFLEPEIFENPPDELYDYVVWFDDSIFRTRTINGFRKLPPLEIISLKKRVP